MNGAICISVCARSVEELVNRVRSASANADIVEVRFDCLDPEEVLLAFANLPDIKADYLLTFRPREQGGSRDIAEAERAALWKRVLQDNGDFLIDIESDAPGLLALMEGRPKTIVSIHNFDGVWDDPTQMFRALAKKGKIVKMAATVDDAHEAVPLWNLLSAAGAADRKVISIAMGEAGTWTRILGPAHGAYLTFASESAALQTAPGQVTIDELTRLYRAREISKETRVFGVLGNPISQSLSRFMHNRAFASVGFDGVFIPFLVKDIDAFMRKMVRPEAREVDLNFGGFSVTMPHKQAIIKYLDLLDATAEKIGAVNTVKIQDGKLIGHNTDAHGFITPLNQRFGDLSGSRVAVVGAGGAARACVYALNERRAAVTVFVRDPARGAAFGEEFGVEVRRIGDFDSREFEILVDTTPVGMPGDQAGESLFTSEQLAGLKFVYDLVTKPYDTPIVVAAKAAGVEAIGGVEMLIAQGAKQLELWTGESAPIDVMRESVYSRFAELTK